MQTNNVQISRGVDRSDRSAGSSWGGLHRAERTDMLREKLRGMTDERLASTLRDDVREARSFVKNWSEKSVSPQTADRYQQRVDMMREHAKEPTDAKSAASYDFDRAAFVYVNRAETKEALRDLDKHRRIGEVDGAARAYLRVQNGLVALRKYPPSTGNRELDLERTSLYGGPAHAERSNGKRDSAQALPPGWGDELQRELNSFDRAPGAVMSLTGARPAEISGVRVRQSADRQSIEFIIRSAKYEADRRGIEQRTVSFGKQELEQSAPGRDVLEFLGNREQRTIAVQGTSDAFRQRYARAAARAGLVDASAYTARHATAKDLRASGEGRTEIARQLGHRTDRAQKTYG